MAYVRNAWYVASWVQDVSSDKPYALSILDEPLVLWRAEDRWIALEDRCSHRLAPLSLGRVEGDSLRCMYHGLRFSTEGKCVEIPGQETIPAQARVKTYPIVEKHSWLWVWMGDPALADVSLVPPAVGFDDPDWILGRGFLDYQAEARLINDNLLDLSHASYVHANSFQGGDVYALERPQLETLSRGVRFSRWTTDVPGSIIRQSDEKVDAYMRYDFLIPGVLLMWTGQFPAGTAAACNFEKPDYSMAIGGVTFTSQAVTPTGDKTSRYFFSWGPHRNHGDEALRDFLLGVAQQAFAEDKVMIEAQQQVIDRTASPSIVAIAHDRGPILFNRLVEQLAQDESSRPIA
jgi:phenylpropionate dioxygenase-like ring-hydroxylating dioxygenase large terminal subunit